METFFPATGRRISVVLVSHGSALTLDLGVLEEVLFLVGLFNLPRYLSAHYLRTAGMITRLLGHGVGLEDINEMAGGGLGNWWVRVKPQTNCIILGISRQPIRRGLGSDQSAVI